MKNNIELHMEENTDGVFEFNGMVTLNYER